MREESSLQTRVTLRHRQPTIVALTMLGFVGISATFLCSKPTHAQNVTDQTAATVNGERITVSDFFERLQRVRGQDFLASLNPPTLRGETAGQIVLSALISERLIMQLATKSNTLPSESEINVEWERLRSQPAVAAALKNKSLTEAAVRRDIRGQRARYNTAVTGIRVMPAEVDTYYKIHLDSYTTPEQWGISAIRIIKGENVPKAAEAIKAGRPFAEVAKMYSDDTVSAARGGDFGTIAITDPKLPPALRDAIRPLKVGEVTPDVPIEAITAPPQSKITYHWFVRLNSRTPAVVRPFAQVKAEAERSLRLERAGGYTKFDKRLADFRQQSTIVVALPAYQNLTNVPKK